MSSPFALRCRNIINYLHKPSKLASMAECTFQLQLTVQSNADTKPLFTPHVLRDGTAFIKFQKTCNVLATLCNQFQTQSRKYFVDVDVFQYLIKRRNDEVNNMIKKAMQADDPFSEVPAEAVTEVMKLKWHV